MRDNKNNLKKILVWLISVFIFAAPVFAKTDKLSEEYLKDRHHFAIMNPLAEKVAQCVIKKTLNKQAKGKYKVKFDGYTLSSMKKGIFKYLEITGKSVDFDNIELPYVKIKTVTDYNWIDYTKEPPVFKSDVTFDYEMHMSEKTINDALKSKEYRKTIKNVNRHAYPLFAINDVRVKLRNNKMHIIMEYNFPIKPASKNRTFMVSSGVNIVNSKIKLENIGFDNAYGSLPIDKVINLVNLIDPLSFTLDLMDDKKCDAKIESAKMDGDIIVINGKIFIKKEVN